MKSRRCRDRTGSKGFPDGMDYRDRRGNKGHADQKGYVGQKGHKVRRVRMAKMG
jgi:hypothetical protein